MSKTKKLEKKDNKKIHKKDEDIILNEKREDKLKENLDIFYKAILSLKNEDECCNFFEDIFTSKELIDIPQRLEVAMLLSQKKTYEEVRKISGASNSTITRVNHCLKYGSGGYKNIEKRI